MVACLRKKESKDDATGNSRVRREATAGGKVGMNGGGWKRYWGKA